jgi:hypothetical protein
MLLFKTFSCFSDTRVRKTLAYLRLRSESVFFSGGKSCDNPIPFFIEGVGYDYLNRDKNILILIKIAWLDFRKMLNCKSGDTVYLVNEHMAFVLFPMVVYWKCRKVKIVLDIYDSILLVYNSNKFIKFSCILLYYLVDVAIVTDENRKNLISNLISLDKIKVLENFPIYNDKHVFKKKSQKVNLFFSGSLHETRGWSFIKQFANIDPFVVYIAGWNRLKHDKFIYPDNFRNLGLLNQEEILDLMNSEIHWVFCLYEPINANNINASPNKIFDAIHTNCGIIVNSELAIANLIQNNNWGLVINSYHDNIDDYINSLINLKDDFLYTEELKIGYSFNKYKDFFISI